MEKDVQHNVMDSGLYNKETLFIIGTQGWFDYVQFVNASPTSID